MHHTAAGIKIAYVDVCSRSDEQPHDLILPPGLGPHQRGVAQAILQEVDREGVLLQVVDQGDVLLSDMQRGV